MPLQVLLVEDSPGDLRLTQEAFRVVNPLVAMHVANDGVEAMAFLRHEGAFLHSTRPDLILLDLNLPKMDGRQVLAQIKEDDDLKTIPTVILTSSEAEADVVRSYQLQANCYLSKPMHFDAFQSLVKSINDFWLSRVKLPGKGGEVREPIGRKTSPVEANRRENPTGFASCFEGTGVARLGSNALEK